MAINQRASDVKNRFQQWMDQAISPDTRQKYRKNMSNFARERPLLCFFLATHLVLSGPPVMLFVSFVTSMVLASLTAATIFSLFWAAGALLLLVPSLFVSISVGMTIWLWGFGMVKATKWAYTKALVGGQKIKEHSDHIAAQRGLEDKREEEKGIHNRKDHGGENKVNGRNGLMEEKKTYGRDGIMEEKKAFIRHGVEDKKNPGFGEENRRLVTDGITGMKNGRDA